MSVSKINSVDLSLLNLSSYSKILGVDIFGGNDVYTKLLMHMDGSDDGTTFTDDSASNHTITRYNAVTKTSEKKIGSASAYFDGSGDRLTAPDSTDWDFGTGDFTIDFWFKVVGITDFDLVVHCGSGAANATSNWHVSFNGSNQIRLTVFESDTPITALSTTDVVTDGAWHHYAGVRSGNNTMVAVDGVFGSSQDVTGVDVRYLASSLLTIGAIYGGTQDPNMYIDELRISKGIARWTSDFTPQTIAYS